MLQTNLLIVRHVPKSSQGLLHNLLLFKLTHLPIPFAKFWFQLGIGLNVYFLWISTMLYDLNRKRWWLKICTMISCFHWRYYYISKTTIPTFNAFNDLSAMSAKHLVLKSLFLKNILSKNWNVQLRFPKGCWKWFLLFQAKGNFKGFSFSRLGKLVFAELFVLLLHLSCSAMSSVDKHFIFALCLRLRYS